MRALRLAAHGCRVVARTLAGPWQIYPGAMALVAIYGLFISAGSRTQVGHKTISSYFGAVLPQWAAIAVTCLVIYLLLHGLRALADGLRPVDRSRLSYIAVLATASVVITAFNVTTTSITVDDQLRATLPPPSVRFILSLPVVALVLFIGNGVIAAARMRIARQEDLLAERLDTVRSERALLLAAEEQVRSEVSRTLHDDVQAALLRAVVRLEGVRERLSGDEQRLFDASIDEIEAVREERVRALGRILSPSIADVGLLQALEELTALYADVMAVELDFPADVVERFQPVGDQDETALALYRIAEQVLLNALKHGRATQLRLTLAQLADGRVRLVVEGDGSPPIPGWRPGSGTATINAWLDAAGGEWSIAERPGGGILVSAVVGRAAQP